MPTGPGGTVEVLIKWQGKSQEEATWEHFDNIHQLFPTFHLEDKVNVWARGNAKDLSKPFDGVVYVRRPKTTAQTPAGQSP